MKTFPLVILGGSVAASYAAKRGTAVYASLDLLRAQLDPRALRTVKSVKSLDRTFGQE